MRRGSEGFLKGSDPPKVGLIFPTVSRYVSPPAPLLLFPEREIAPLRRMKRKSFASTHTHTHIHTHARAQKIGGETFRTCRIHIESFFPFDQEESYPG